MNRVKLHRYQEDMAQHIADHKECALFAEMGTGKTIGTLTAIADLEQPPVLIVAPLLVAQTVWAQEAMKWDHTRHLNFSHVLGTPNQRLMALNMYSDVYIINRENLPWLSKQENLPEFSMIVLDELSGYRKPGGARVQAVRRLRSRFHPRMVGLTGTPAPNGLLGLFSQIKCLDGGARLGTNFENFKRRHFIPIDFKHFQWEPMPQTGEWIKNQLSDVVMSLRSKDYLELPELMDNPFEIDLPYDVMQKYHDFERNSVLVPSKDDKEPITAVNAAVLCGKLTQLASGKVYDDPDSPEEGKSFQTYHWEKGRVLRDIVDDMQSSPMLVAYWYQHSKAAIMKAIPEAAELNEENIELWNKGKVPVMMIHPASAGHGLNLQDGGHQIVWYDMPYDLELYEQTIARLYRQGQKLPVFNHLLIANGTVDESIYAALKAKKNVQDALMENLKRAQQ